MQPFGAAEEYPMFAMKTKYPILMIIALIVLGASIRLVAKGDDAGDTLQVRPHQNPHSLLLSS